MTMKELAKLANVSVSAVSKAFSEADDISLETKEHIFSLAKEYGCYGKFYKGKYHKKIVAIICPELLGNYYTYFVDILRELIEAAECMCVVSADNFSSAKQAELIDYYISYLKVDGLIVFNLSTSIKKAYDTPIVSLFSESSEHIDSVTTDMRGAIHRAVDTLAELGHNKIAFIGEPLTRSKAEFFQQAIATHSQCSAFLVESTQRFEKAGEDGVRQLIENHPPVTAIVCAYDNIAYGAIRQLKKEGFLVPQDISVIGIDNNIVSEYTKPSLTTIDTNPREVCQIAWELLHRKLFDHGFKAQQSIVIKADLVLRESISHVKVP